VHARRGRRGDATSRARSRAAVTPRTASYPFALRSRRQYNLAEYLMHKIPRARAHPPHTARSQVYQDVSTDVFESQYCVVADYGVFANGTISVRNRQRDGSVNGAYNGILGWAALNNRTGLTTADGSLSVFLQLPAPAPQGIPAPYDIILLGPSTHGEFGAYEYAVVSDPFEISLFVLARDVDDFYKNYNATVFAELKALVRARGVRHDVSML
jgi:hypothetical protein